MKTVIWEIKFMYDPPSQSMKQTGLGDWISNSLRRFCYRVHIPSYCDKQLLILKIFPKSGLICASLKHQSFFLSVYILQLQGKSMYSPQDPLKGNWQLHFLTESDFVHIYQQPCECMRHLKRCHCCVVMLYLPLLPLQFLLNVFIYLFVMSSTRQVYCFSSFSDFQMILQVS